MNEDFDLEIHLPQQIFLPLPLINVALPPEFHWWNLSPSKQHWVRGGGRETIYAILSVFLYGEIEKYARLLHLSQLVLSTIAGLKLGGRTVARGD